MISARVGNERRLSRDLLIELGVEHYQRTAELPTLSDVARVVGVRRSSLAHYFTTREYMTEILRRVTNHVVM